MGFHLDPCSANLALFGKDSLLLAPFVEQDGTNQKVIPIPAFYVLKENIRTRMVKCAAMLVVLGRTARGLGYLRRRRAVRGRTTPALARRCA